MCKVEDHIITVLNDSDFFGECTYLEVDSHESSSTVTVESDLYEFDFIFPFLITPISHSFLIIFFYTVYKLLKLVMIG